jgi:SAM-dependent methyltransferase
MFALTDADLGCRIVGCGDGPASFNAELTRRGGRVVSCDPLYRFGEDEIRGRIAATYEQVMDQARRNADDFVWTGAIRSLEDLGRQRMRAMDAFLADYETGRSTGRYLDAPLPTLPFADGAFDLALCSHYLFLYAAQVSEAEHVAGVREMCRVAREVRVFPLVELGGARSPHVEPCLAALAALGFQVSIERVAYEFRRGANEMLRIVFRS